MRFCKATAGPHQVQQVLSFNYSRQSEEKIAIETSNDYITISHGNHPLESKA